MSYNKSFTKTITISGSKSVHYPSSEHGGSMWVDYSETVPVHINITVNTMDFDKSVISTTDSVKGLTNAMVNFDSDQCKIIDENSRRITQSIVNGFYNVVNSNITMQKAENNTVVQAKFALLMSLSKAMTQKHDRMVDDVSRLYKHYSALFEDMDQDLEKRIKELDKNVFYLSEYVHNQMLISPLKQDVASNFDTMKNVNTTNALVEGARVKSKTSEVFNQLTDKLIKDSHYSDLMAGMLENVQINRPKVSYIPVVFSKTADLNYQQYKTRAYAPICKEQDIIETSVNNYVCMQEDNKWKKYKENDLVQIDQSIMNLVEDQAKQGNAVDDRVYQEIIKLWSNDKDKMKHL